MKLISILAGLVVKAPLPEKWTCNDRFLCGTWKLPATFNSGGNWRENINCSAFLLSSIFWDTFWDTAVFLVFKSMIKPYAQWEEIPLHLCVLVCEGQLAMLRLCQLAVVLCGSHTAAQGSGGQVRELPSAHTACTPGAKY